MCRVEAWEKSPSLDRTLASCPSSLLNKKKDLLTAQDLINASNDKAQWIFRLLSIRPPNVTLRCITRMHHPS
jgi:hypothetical protein